MERDANRGMIWAAGMTAAPRKTSTIRQALAGARLNDWEPVVFAEPGTDLEGVDSPIVQHPQKMGIFHNWYFMARWLLENRPQVTHVLTMQDDAVLSPGARLFAEQWEPPKDAGLLSLYLPRAMTRKGRHRRPAGVFRADGHTLHGSLAIVYRREILERIVNHGATRRWATRLRVPSAICEDDICVGLTLRELRLKIYHTAPSCCQHVSPHSTRVGAGGAVGDRMAEWVAVDAIRDCQPNPERDCQR